MAELPSGTVTFLFTDLEGSTRIWEERREAMASAVERHDVLLEQAIARHGGVVFSRGGDGMAAAFGTARGAIAAAVDAQRALAAEPWDDTGTLRSRMGVHTGDGRIVGEQRDQYESHTLNRCARLMAVAHGEQLVISGTTAALVTGDLPDGCELVELGEHRLRDLRSAMQVFQVCAPGLRSEFPPLRVPATTLGNLPAETQRLLGREAQVVTLTDALREHRLVTLSGVGGVGKTRLALHAAAAAQGEHRDGAWVVELAPVLDGADVADAAAAVFAVVPQPGCDIVDGLAESLRARRLLLVLDNCEHVLEEAAVLAERLLARCPDLTVLATSRESLGVAGEWVWPVPSLDVGFESSSSELFVERARAVAPELDCDRDADAVAEICRRLDGIPLAIELAAARVRSMSPTQIRDRLDERFRLLTSSGRALERHQTLHHAVQWSFDLLNETEQCVLREASVFAGGFTLDAATAVCKGAPGDLDDLQMLDVVDSLVRKSLVQVERTTAEPRYTMLETIRQFGNERLAEGAERDAARDRHATYFADRADDAFELFRSPREAEAYPFIDAEIANLRAAFRWAVDNRRADPAIRIAGGAHIIARMRLRTETFGWAAEVTDLARQVEHHQLPQLLSMASDSAWSLGLLDEAKGYGRESIALADESRFEPFLWSYIDLAEIARFEGDAGAALELLRAGAAHPADGRDRFVLCALLEQSGNAGEHLPDDELAAAVDRVKAAGVPIAIASALSGQAASVAVRDVAAAIELYEEAIDLLGACGNRLFEQRVRAWLGGLIATREDPERALASFVEIVSAWRINGDTMLAVGVAHLVALLARLGHHEGAACLYGAVTRTISLDEVVPELAPAMAAARAALGDVAFDNARGAGAALSYEDAGEFAQALITRARTELNGS